MLASSRLGGFASLVYVALFSSFVSATPSQDYVDNQKYIFAHHVVGNTFPYTVKDWEDDIVLASKNGIDAFALNMGSDSWQVDQVSNAYSAAQNFGGTFRLFLSFDMTVLPCDTPAAAATLSNMVSRFANHPAQLKYGGKAFVSTFAGEKCTFGEASPQTGWGAQFLKQLAEGSTIFFCPNFFVDPAGALSFGNITDCHFNWNSAWPIGVTNVSYAASIQQAGATVAKVVSSPDSPLSTEIGRVSRNITGSLASDNVFIDTLKSAGKAYMAAVSPWFFTHYSAQTFNKNFVYLADQLYSTRWQSIISKRNDISLVEIATWNDYGESHYIGPIKGSQPNSSAWVNGFDHTSWLDLTKYFAAAYKNGAYPAISRDKIYIWTRPHTKDAEAKSDPIGKPTNYEVLEDALFIVLLAAQPSNATVATSSFSQTVSIGTGLTQLSVPLYKGDSFHITLSRNDWIVAQIAPAFEYSSAPDTYNYNALTLMAEGIPVQAIEGGQAHRHGKISGAEGSRVPILFSLYATAAVITLVSLFLL